MDDYKFWIQILITVAAVAAGFGAVKTSLKFQEHSINRLEIKVDKHNQFGARLCVIESQQAKMQDDFSNLRDSLQRKNII